MLSVCSIVKEKTESTEDFSERSKTEEAGRNRTLFLALVSPICFGQNIHSSERILVGYPSLAASFPMPSGRPATAKMMFFCLGKHNPALGEISRNGQLSFSYPTDYWLIENSHFLLA